MAHVEPLTELATWQELWNLSKSADAPSILIFKRSPICPTSFFAEGIFNRYISSLDENPALKIVSVDVIAARPISQRIAADTGVQHQSPQALLVKAGQEITWHASHGDIDEAALKQHVSA